MGMPSSGSTSMPMSLGGNCQRLTWTLVAEAWRSSMTVRLRSSRRGSTLVNRMGGVILVVLTFTA